VVANELSVTILGFVRSYKISLASTIKREFMKDMAMFMAFLAVEWYVIIV
jgi:hypothetical protein